MPIDPLVAIHSELARIASTVSILSYLGGVALTLVIIRGVFAATREYHNLMETKFSREAEALLSENKLAELKTLALDKLKTQPNHEYARWYLARALYLSRDYDCASREFAFLERICPSWKAEHIEPYVREIEEQIQGSKSK